MRGERCKQASFVSFARGANSAIPFSSSRRVNTRNVKGTLRTASRPYQREFSNFGMWGELEHIRNSFRRSELWSKLARTWPEANGFF